MRVVKGTILEIKTRTQKGNKWLDVTIDEGDGGTPFLYRADIGGVRRYAEANNLTIQELVGTPIVLEV